MKTYPAWTRPGGGTFIHAPEWLGFVYLITAPSGMKYVGKKLFRSAIRRKPLKGTKRVRLDHKESDWRKYFGSSKELLAELSRTNPMHWKREILHLCTSKWAMAYLELKEQMARDVLMREDYFNGILHIRLGKPNAATARECGLLPPTRIRTKAIPS
jgi:hypothetical protein